MATATLRCGLAGRQTPVEGVRGGWAAHSVVVMSSRAIGWWRRRSGTRVLAAGTEPGVRPQSRAVLIGVSSYDDARLASIGAECGSVDALRALLSDPMLGLWPPGQVTVILEPDSASDLAERIAELAAGTTGTLLLYYLGHGVLSASGRLYLAVRSTRPSRPESTALAWDALAQTLRNCPAQTRRVILDCPVTGALSTSQGLVDLTRLDGVCTLTATRPVDNPQAAARDTGRADLIGELVDLIRSGIPTKPAWLTLTDIYPSLCERLLARDIPIPKYSGTDNDHRFPFIANAALRNVDRAATLLRDATRVARSIDNPTHRAYALSDIAEALAPIDPEQAERLAYAVPSNSSKPEALARVARSLADSAPHHAARLLDDAHRLAGSIHDDRSRAQTLALIVWGLARTDPDRAERLAGSITDDHDRAMAYAGIVRTLVLTHPDRAEQLAYEITDPYWRSCALLDVTEQLATVDPDKAEQVLNDAERTTRSVSSTSVRAMTLAAVARLRAARSPSRAGRVLDDAVDLAYSIPDQHDRMLSITNVVVAMAGMDPDRADDLLTDAERLARPNTDQGLMAAQLTFVVRALSTIAPSRAEHLAYSITEKRAKVSALVNVAQRWTEGR